jgi:hypothetical protein
LLRGKTALSELVEMNRFVQKLACVVLCSAAWLAVSGCAARSGAASYRLFAQPEQRLLIPPGVKDAAVTRRSIEFRTAAGAGACGQGEPQREGQPQGEDAVRLQRRRPGRLRLTVDRDALEKQPAGWLTQWAAALERRGCIASGEGLRLATSLAHAVPLRLQTEQRLLNADVRSSGYSDLWPGYRLRVVSPVFRDGAPPGASALQPESKVEAAAGGLIVTAKASPDLIGYETAWYALEPRAGGGARIVPQYAEFHSEGEVTREPAPRRNHLAFDPAMAYFRLLFMARRTESNDHDIVVIAAATQPKLDEKTQALEAGTESCAAASSDAPESARAIASESATAGTPESACTVAPAQVAILVFLRVTVQGREVLAHPGDTLDSALREAGAADPAEILSTLVVRKPYEGRLTPLEFSRAAPDILDLPLAGGEEIRW